MEFQLLWMEFNLQWKKFVLVRMYCGSYWMKQEKNFLGLEAR